VRVLFFVCVVVVVGGVLGAQLLLGVCGVGCVFGFVCVLVCCLVMQAETSCGFRELRVAVVRFFPIPPL
jgi:hypothetical protein